MPVLTGKDGTLRLANTEVLHLANWQIEKTAANKSYTANDTGGARARVAGVKDCTGRLEIKATDSGTLPLAEGDTVALALHADDSGQNYYGLSAVIDAVRVEVDISDAKPVAYLVRFSGNGPITAHGVLGK
jgi:D-mannonate dehydratase